MMLRFAAAFVFCFSASASTIHSPDYTDMWWNAAESGWGINVVQQNQTIFATWFVYGNDGKAHWYVASGMLPQQSPTGYVFSGQLYETTGPWIGVPFTPAPTSEPVGTATLSFNSVSNATLTYNVGTTNVTKSITRYTFSATTPAGLYYPAGLTLISSGCTGGTQNGALYAQGLMRVTVTGSQVNFNLNINNGQATCNFDGTLVSDGRFASVNSGTWSCVAGGSTTNTGNFTIAMLDVQLQHMTGIFNGADQSCSLSGRFGGLRDVVN